MGIEISWEYFRNFHIKISMENWLFFHFLSLLPWPFSFYTALEINTLYLQQYFRGGGWSFLPLSPHCGRPWNISNVLVVEGENYPKIGTFNNLPKNLKNHEETMKNIIFISGLVLLILCEGIFKRNNKSYINNWQISAFHRNPQVFPIDKVVFHSGSIF